MKNYIIHLGVSGFPQGNAVMQRVKMTFKSIKESGFNVLIFSKKSIHTNKKAIQRIEGIPYIHTSYYINRPESFLKRNFNKMSGFVGELKTLIRLRKKIHSALVYTPFFGELLYYKFLSKILGFKLILVYVEFRSSILERQSGFTKFNDRWFDNYCYKFCDSAIVISEFLKKHLEKKNKNLPLLKIPAITDFREFQGINPIVIEDGYIMYCGTIDYLDIIQFILDVFIQLKEKSNYKGKLVLVISGNNTDKWPKLNKAITNITIQNDIIVKSDITYKELVSYYLGSDVLLIPLRHNIQDIARCPHKISEYTAAKRPIVSTEVGELKYYFVNNDSALLAKEYSIASYLNCLVPIIDNKDKIDKIGIEGYKIGVQNFNYAAYNSLLKNFILYNK